MTLQQIELLNFGHRSPKILSHSPLPLVHLFGGLNDYIFNGSFFLIVVLQDSPPLAIQISFFTYLGLDLF